MSRLILLLPLIGCTATADDEQRQTVIDALSRDVVLAGYETFDTQTGALVDAVNAFCNAPDEASLTTARDAWWAAKEPWKRVEIVQFGPIVEYPDRFGPKLDDWPVNASAVEDLITSDDPVHAEAFQNMGSATRGLPVVEYLLWTDTTDPLTALQTDSRRCEVLMGASRDIQYNASGIATTWRDDWIPRLSDPANATDDMYDTPQDVIDEWVNRMVFTVENIRAKKLGKPIGDKANGNPQPDTIESRLSGRSLNDARDALAGVRDVWSSPNGIATLLRERDASLKADIDNDLEVTATRLAEIPETLELSVLVEPEIIVRAQDALKTLQIAIQVDLAQALSVSITFNDNDGD